MPTGLRRLISEIHRRSLWQVLGIYLGGAWVAYQVVLSLVQGLGLPDWVPPVALILFLVGLPVVMATAFVQEGPIPGPDSSTPASAATGAPAPGPSPALTWRRAGVAGGSAFVGLGMIVAVLMLMHRAGIGPIGSLAAKGELGETPTVLLAELDPLTGDSALARVVTEAIRVDLSQSTFLSTVDRSRIRYTLERMGRPPGSRLDGDLAREAAIRMGVGVVAEGDVSRAGSGYNLSLRLVTPDSGRVVASYRETASDSTDILPAVDRLSRRLRSHAGESLRAVRASTPLRELTTSSLEALQRYTQAGEAFDRGERARSDQYYREAIEIDPEFASARRALAISFLNGQVFPDSALFHLEEALRMEHRLSEAELRSTRGVYFTATGRQQEALFEFTAITELDPESTGGWVNRGVALERLGRHAEAGAAFQRAWELGDRRPSPVGWNLTRSLLGQGKIEEASTIVDVMEEEFPDQGLTEGLRFLVLLAEGNLDATAAWLEERGFGWEELPLLRGRPAPALEIAGGMRQNPDPYLRLMAATGQAYVELWVLEDREAAAETLLDALSDPEIDELPAGVRPLAWPALALAAAGRPAEARTWRSRHEANVPEPMLRPQASVGWATEALALAAEGDLESAIPLLRRARQDPFCPACWEPMAARVFEAAGQPDSAAAAFARYVDTPWTDAWILMFPYSGPTHFHLLASSHENAARLYRELGNVPEAERHEARFLELWAEPDPRLRPRVEAVRARQR
jgi:tetratricopeptide (TPR) repeat protein